jgi:hypothetical protein
VDGGLCQSSGSLFGAISELPAADPSSLNQSLLISSEGTAGFVSNYLKMWIILQRKYGILIL